MIIYPAIDLYERKAVRLKRGDYAQMTVYSEKPVSVALGFKKAGAAAIHVVDLEGARDGKPANFETIRQIISQSGLEVQVGGGIRTYETIEKYLDIGVRRVILGTAAVSEPGFLAKAVSDFSDSIAVAADIKDGLVAIKGWTELSDLDIFSFCDRVSETGVRTLICTDVSKDGLLGGANIGLYKTLREKLSAALIASGGVSSAEEIKTLTRLGIDGAIIGKALYEGRLDLTEAVRLAALDDK